VSLDFLNPSVFPLAQQPKSDPRRLTVEVYRSHTHTHNTRRTSLDEWSARHRSRYLHNTKQTQETNIRALGGIRTRDPSCKGPVDLMATGSVIHWLLQPQLITFQNFAFCHTYVCGGSTCTCNRQLLTSPQKNNRFLFIMQMQIVVCEGGTVLSYRLGWVWFWSQNGTLISGMSN
jgi:hypothetical protein